MEPTAPPNARTVWVQHGLLLVATLGGTLAWLAFAGGVTDFVLAFAFIFLPLAVAYTLVSTVAVWILRRRRWGVALAHALALGAGLGAMSFFVKGV